MKTIIHDPKTCRSSTIANIILLSDENHHFTLKIGRETFIIARTKRSTFARGIMAAMSMMEREREAK